MPLARIFLPAVRPAHLPQAPLAPLVVALVACILAVLLCRNGFDIIPSKTPPHKLALLSLVSRIGWSGLPVRPSTKLGEGLGRYLFAWAGYRATNHFFKQRSIRRIDPQEQRIGLMIKWAMRGRRAAGRGLAATNRSSGAAGNDGRQVWGHRIVGACPLQNKQVAKSLEEPARNVSLLSRSPGRALLALARPARHRPEHQRREPPPCPASSRPAWPPHLPRANWPNRCSHSSHDPTPQRPPPPATNDHR